MPSAFDIIRDEMSGFHPRLLFIRILMLPFPPYAGSRFRAFALRMAGFRIGRGTLFWGMPTITGNGNLYKNLTIGEGCWINQACLLDVSAPITIQNGVSIGQEVMILTGTHQIGPPLHRAIGFESRQVTIGVGAWLAARATILPGVTIGSGAVIAAGAVVTKDIPPNVLAGGVPCQVIRDLGTEEA